MGLSEEDFWELSLGQWHELNSARLDNLRIYDGMHARIRAEIQASVPSKKKKKIKIRDLMMFPVNAIKGRPSQQELKNKFMGIAAVVNAAFEFNKGAKKD